MVAETFVDMDEEVQALPANYGEYYSNTDWRAQRIDERRLMALYTTSRANASTGLALYEEAVRTSDVVPQGLVVNSGRNFRFPERNRYIPALGARKGIPVRNNYFAMRPTAQSRIPVS
jgi:hypothetical protein